MPFTVPVYLPALPLLTCTLANCALILLCSSRCLHSTSPPHPTQLLTHTAHCRIWSLVMCIICPGACLPPPVSRLTFRALHSSLTCLSPSKPAAPIRPSHLGPGCWCDCDSECAQLGKHHTSHDGSSESGASETLSLILRSWTCVRNGDSTGVLRAVLRP